MAEFVEVMRHKVRMCKQAVTCEECPMFKGFWGIASRLLPIEQCYAFVGRHPDEAESIIMDWAAKHPEKTMKDVFFEKFPNAPRDELGDPRMCPLDVGYPARPDGAGYEGECHTENPCTGCWSRPAPEE